MKAIKIIGLFLAACILSFKAMGQEADGQTVKVISFNIWNGFEKDAARKARFVDGMNEQKPQIVALEEVVGFSE